MPDGLWARFVWAATSEWLLTTRKKPSNGGRVIFARALISATLAWVFIVFMRELVDPKGLVWSYTFDQLRLEVVRSAPLFGAVFAGAFASFYARFASQWGYVASMYNQIKAAEVRGVPNAKARRALAQWKAGFIEDAADLHLATKTGIATTVVAWSGDKAVEHEFVDHCGGQQRFDEIVSRAAANANPAV